MARRDEALDAVETDLIVTPRYSNRIHYPILHGVDQRRG